jgi:hypothetical protein
MARLDPHLPLISECVWRLHGRHASQGWFDGHALINLLNAEHNADLNRLYALFRNASDPQRIGDIQIGKSLYGYGQQKTGEVVTAREIDTPHGNRHGTCAVSAWAVTGETTGALEQWMWRNCPDRLTGLLGAAWPDCTNPARMLGWLNAIPATRRCRPTARKSRLFACAVVRLAWNRLADGRSRNVVEVAERFADGLASQDELTTARGAAALACQAAESIQPLLQAAQAVAAQNAALAAQDAAAQVRLFDGSTSSVQCDLLRDIFGNPFRPPSPVAPAVLAWNGGTVSRLAQAAHDAHRLPTGMLDLAHFTILADAMEEAGYTDTEILAHLRGPAPHSRGCHVLDLVLGLARPEPRLFPLAAS